MISCGAVLFLSVFSTVAWCTVDVNVRRNGARSIIYCMVVSTTTESIFLQRIYKAINFHLILVYAWCTSFCFQFSYSSFEWSGIRWISFISIGLIDNNAIRVGWFFIFFFLCCSCYWFIYTCVCLSLRRFSLLRAKTFWSPIQHITKSPTLAFAGSLVKVD